MLATAGLGLARFDPVTPSCQAIQVQGCAAGKITIICSLNSQLYCLIYAPWWNDQTLDKLENGQLSRELV